MLKVVSSVLTYDPMPLAKPLVSDDFAEASVAGRALEATRYFINVTEYRLSADGWLRAWIASCTRILLFFVIPIAVAAIVVWALVPVVAGTERVFASLAAIADYLQRVCGSLLKAAVYILLTLIVVAAIIAFLALFLRTKGDASGRRFVPSRTV